MITKRSEITYIAYLTEKQFGRMKKDLGSRGYNIKGNVPHTFYRASKNGINITAFKNGKLLIQGKGAHDFIEFYLEPVLLKKITLGYEEILDPSIGESRIGVDESGKGDYFGPLVIGAVYVDRDIVKRFMDLGVSDSKSLSAKRVEKLAKEIRADANHSIVAIGPEKYNTLYDKIGNLNKLLAWGHARALENVLIKNSNCRKAILDKFADKNVLNVALMKRGRKIDIVLRTKAESDIAVAAASIIARDEFCKRLAKLEEEFKMKLPKGASAAVEKTAKKIVAAYGVESLTKVVKLHFKISKKVILES